MEAPPAQPTLVEAWRRAARDFSDRGLGLLDSRGREGEHRSYAELWDRIQVAGARMQTLGIEPGEVLPVCLPSSWEFFETWFGAMALGALPVAIAPPGAMGSAEYQLARLEQIIAQLGARRIACRGALREEAQRLGKSALAACALPAEERAAAPADRTFRPHEADPEDVAFLQLTSGSTGLPRAVMIRHRSAVLNPIAIDLAIAAPCAGAGARGDGITGISWLPLYHDMGLVGCLLYCLLAGIDLWMMPPKAFMGRPQAWLNALGAYPATFSPAPNFAYQTCIERLRPQAIEKLDLKPWRAAMIGAEMIRPETLLSFAETFASTGFDPRALRPCYGLAEATLAVTFDQRGEGLRTRPLPAGAAAGSGPSEVTCVGTPLHGTELRITAPDGTALGEESIGEVQVRGDGVFAGYYRDQEATSASLVDGWLRTGDLGFLAGGELWLTGRIKDLIIINGQNLMPHELEWLAEEASGGGGSMRCCALSVAPPGEGERPVLVVEVGNADGRGLAELERHIRIHVGRALGVPLMDVCFVRRGRIPKTSSGKVRRREVQRLYLAKELERIPLEIP